MKISNRVLSANQKIYANKYAKFEGFMEYPADWIIRFHNMYLKKNLPSGRVLDYGCGSGNNSVFFIEKGYEVYGIDVSKNIHQLIKKNLKRRHLNTRLLKNFTHISPYCTKLRFKKNFFDFVFSNQVLYYLPSREYIQTVCREISRCLRPGGIVFFTMMGPRNYYITQHSKEVLSNKIHRIIFLVPGHRLDGTEEYIYLVKDEDELKDLFSEFQCISSGYFDQSMFDLTSNFHWIFIGKKE